MDGDVMKRGFLIAAILGAFPAHSIISSNPVFNDLSEQVSSQIRTQIAQRFAKHESVFDVSIEQLTFSPPLDAREKEVKVLSILGLGSQGSQRLDGLFVVDAMIKTSAGIQDRKISGLLRVVGPVVVARRAINSGENLAESDIEEIRLPWKNFPAGAHYTNPSELRGRKLKAYVPAGGMLFSGILQDIENVRTGDWVNLTLLTSGGVMIRSKAVSKQPGQIGDSIRVENPDTKKILTGIIVGNQEVEVQL
jgi:flagella basal body P-ring formation protein FlgA